MHVRACVRIVQAHSQARRLDRLHAACSASLLLLPTRHLHVPRELTGSEPGRGPDVVIEAVGFHYASR